MEKEKYVVIGGQYEHAYYGTFDSLHAAKMHATRCVEYWDNWKGWHTPNIYRFDDTEEIVTKGMITCSDGLKMRVPKEDCKTKMVKCSDGWHWIEL